MTQGAYVSSVEALNAFKTALIKFMDQADKSLIEADMEIHRVNDWINRDQPAYWANEKKKREKEIAKAKDELRRVTLSITQHTPSAVEQRKALKRAQQREEEAREKIETVKKWKVFFEKAMNEYRGQTQHIVTAIEADLPKAVALIERLAANLDAYLTLTPPPTDANLLGDGETQASSSMTMPTSERKRQPRKRETIDLETCLQFRKKTPLGAERESAELGSPYQDLPKHGPENDMKSKLLFKSRLDVTSVTARPGDLVLYEKGAFKAERYYLERKNIDSAGDSGWYAGLVDENHSARQYGVSACTVSRVLAAIPGLEEILSLPPGYLVLVNKGEIEIMINKNDNAALDWNTQ